MKEEEMINIPKWQLMDIHETLRLVANHHNSIERGTCLSRLIMVSLNTVVNAINGDTEASTHYLTKGQYPKIINNGK